MSRTSFLTLATVASMALAASAGAQGQDSARAPGGGPPIRRIATASAVSKEALGQVAAVRELPGGLVLVNDAGRRRLVLMDSSLAVVKVVLDSLTDRENGYGARAGALIPMRGDSTLFVDPASFTMLVIDPRGDVVRVRAVPRMQDAGMISNSTYGQPGIDARGRLVYRRGAQAQPPRVRPPAGVPWIPSEPDSAFLVAVDIDRRAVDTVGVLRTPKQSLQVRVGRAGDWDVQSMTNPLPLTDDWAVTSDGRVAFVRARDYRVEFRDSAGAVVSGPRLPYDWKRLLDEDKQRIVDSIRTRQRRDAQRNYATEMIRWVNRYGKKEYPKGFAVPADFTLSNGNPRDWVLPPGMTWPERYIFACGADEEPRMLEDGARDAGRAASVTQSTSQQGTAEGRAAEGRGAEGRGPSGGRPSCIPSPTFIPGGNVPDPPRLREEGVIDPEDLPDYRPPLATGGVVRADLDGGLWIRPIQQTPIPGGPVYDVVDAKGELVDRLQLPPGYQLVGFGKGRVVYLQMRDASGVKVARVRLR